MNRDLRTYFAVGLVLVVTAAVALSCGTFVPPARELPRLKAADFTEGFPEVQIAWPNLRIDWFTPQSNYGVQFLGHRKGSYGLDIESRYVAANTEVPGIDLAKLGFTQSDMATLKVHLVNVDGSTTPLTVKRE